MKNHKRFEELIQGYLDDTLSEEERKGLENHLEACEACREKLKIREDLLGKLRIGREEIQCPDYLIDNILKNTTRKETPVIISSSKIRWRYLVPCAAAALIVITTVLLNIEDISQMTTTKKPQGFTAKETLEKEKILENKTAVSPAKREAEEIRDEEPHLVSGVERATATEAALPEKKVRVTPIEQPKEAHLTEGSQEFTVSKKSEEKAPMFSKAAKAPPPAAIKGDQFDKTRTFKLVADMEMESISSKVSEHAILGEGISIRFYEETRFVFPEEGSVVGKDFDIILILENPAEAIEISLDGEKIVNYTIEEDSNIIFIGSDSIPPLEEGLHYLSLKAKEEKCITFYKEG
jgi:hypothetical protein